MIDARSIGDRTIRPVGLGLQMLAASTDISTSNAVRIIHAALDAGVGILDMADCYAPNGCWSGQAERIAGEALRTWAGDAHSIIIATKGGHLLGSHPRDISRNGTPEHLKAACEASLRALGRDAIDLYQLHSPDPNVPLSESVGALAELQTQGKIRMIGLSNVGRSQIRVASEAIPNSMCVASVQNRMSLASPESRHVLEWCGECGISFLPYSPFAREEAGALGKNFTALAQIAIAHGVSPQRVALAWLLALGEHVIPLPGATRIEHVLDNVAAAEMALSPEELARLNEAANGSLKKQAMRE